MPRMAFREERLGSGMDIAWILEVGPPPWPPRPPCGPRTTTPPTSIITPHFPRGHTDCPVRHADANHTANKVGLRRSLSNLFHGLECTRLPSSARINPAIQKRSFLYIPRLPFRCKNTDSPLWLLSLSCRPGASLQSPLILAMSCQRSKTMSMADSQSRCSTTFSEGSRLILDVKTHGQMHIWRHLRPRKSPLGRARLP